MYTVQMLVTVTVAILHSLLSCADVALHALSSGYDEREEGVEGYANGWRD